MAKDRTKRAPRPRKFILKAEGIPTSVFPVTCSADRGCEHSRNQKSECHRFRSIPRSVPLYPIWLQERGSHFSYPLSCSHWFCTPGGILSLSQRHIDGRTKQNTL